MYDNMINTPQGLLLDKLLKLIMLCSVGLNDLYFHFSTNVYLKMLS